MFDAMPKSPSPLVSIIIPYYRQEAFLRESVRSALSQTHFPLEVIVVDDGSPEPASDLLRELVEVRVLRQPNRGVSAARNTGLDAAGGQFVVFLDADDRLVPDALQQGLKVLRDAPWADMAFGSIHLMDTTGILTGSVIRKGSGITEVSYEELLRSCEVQCTASAVYRRGPLRSPLRFTEGIHFGEDYDFYLRFAREYRLVSHPRVVACYRQHAASASHRMGEMHSGIQAILQREFRAAGRDRRLRRAARAGMRRVDRWILPYLLLDALTQNFRQRRYRHALRAGVHLLVRYPGVFLQNAVRRVRIVLKGDR